MQRQGKSKKSKINLTPDQRQYIIEDEHYSRISDIAKSGDNPFLKQWRERVGDAEADRITREAGEYGDLVHEVTMWNDLGKIRRVNALLKKHSFLEPHLMAWRKWVDAVIVEWIAIEQLVWSHKWMCAGRIDRVGLITGDDAPSIIDVKTGGMWDTIGVQLAGYMVLYNETAKRKVHRRLAISLPRKSPGALTTKEFTEDRFVDEFYSKAGLFRSMNQ